jgi:pyruvate,water dikinase
MTTPLTETVTIRLYTAALYSFGNLFFGNNAELIMNYRDELAGTFYSANGRMYVNLTKLSVLLDTLSLSKGILKGIAAKFNIDDISQIKSGLGEGVSFFTRFKSTFNYRKLFFRNDIMMSTVKRELTATEFQAKTLNLTSLTNEQLRDVWNETVKKYTDVWGNAIWNNLVGLICSRKVKKGLSGVGIVEPENFIKPIYIASEIEGAKPLYGLLRLAKTAIETYSVDKLEKFSSEAEVLDFLYMNENDEFATAFKKYREEYGDFSGSYYKLETATFDRSALNLVKELLVYAKNASLLNSTLDSFNVGKFDFHLPPGLGLRKFALNFYLRRLRSSLANAQAVEELRVRAYGFLRNIIEQIGINFVKSGKIKVIRDIYYLTLSEVFALIDIKAEVDKTSMDKYHTIISNRKRDYANFGNLPAYTRIVFNGEVFNKSCGNIAGVIQEEVENAAENGENDAAENGENVAAIDGENVDNAVAETETENNAAAPVANDIDIDDDEDDEIDTAILESAIAASNNTTGNAADMAKAIEAMLVAETDNSNTPTENLEDYKTNFLRKLSE